MQTSILQFKIKQLSLHYVIMDWLLTTDKYMKGFKLVMLAAVCFMAACSVLVSCGHNGQENNSTLKDSIYNVENIKATVMTL